MITIEITRGFEFNLEVPNQHCMLILKSDTDKLYISSVIDENGKCSLNAAANVTANFKSGIYKYQLVDNVEILAQGEAIIQQNFALVDSDVSVKSKNEITLEAIEAQIAGIATQAQASIHVGDKSISYMSLEQLLKAQEYFKAKVAEQRGEFAVGNSGKIKYKWSGY